jgi:hypothetical protein
MTRRKRTVEPVFHRLDPDLLEKVDQGLLDADDLLVVPRPARLFADDGPAIVGKLRRAREGEREVST